MWNGRGFNGHGTGGAVCRSAFTLVELLVVMAIMALIMGITTLGYFGMRRGAEMRGAEGTVRTTLMLARQQAIIKRAKVQVEFLAGEPDQMRVSLLQSAGGTQDVHHVASLPRGVKFSPVPARITFAPAGSTDAMAPVSIVLKERYPRPDGKQFDSSISVWPITGITRID